MIERTTLHDEPAYKITGESIPGMPDVNWMLVKERSMDPVLAAWVAHNEPLRADWWRTLRYPSATVRHLCQHIRNHFAANAVTG